jgi:anaerobic selenocysteine-containing dehydrogenase
MRGSGSLAYNMAYWDVLFSQFPNCYSTSGGPCDDTGGDAHERDFGAGINPPVTNLQNADTIIVYGRNVATCSQHLYAYLKELKKAGKTIIYLDPVKTKTADLADKYIMIKPAADGLLACALLVGLGLEDRYDIDELIAKAGISRNDYDYVLNAVKSGKTGHVQGCGLQRQKNGMNAFRWINRLATLTDSIDTLYYGHGSKRKWKGLKKSFKGKIHVDKIAENLKKGEFDLFINIAANPVMTYPDTHLWEDALNNTKTLVVDTNDSKTSEHADFFLKVAGMFSQPDFMASYFFEHDHSRGKIVDETNDTETAKMLAEELGLSFEIKKISEIERVELPTRKYTGEQIDLTMPTTSDKFQLITSSHYKYINSQTTDEIVAGLQVVHINTADAEILGIKDGDDVKVSSKLGYYVAEAIVTDDITEKTIMSWKNIPMKEGFLNNVIPSELTDSGEGLLYYTHFVDLEKV